MGKMLDWFKGPQPVTLEEDVNLALREMAGWPLQSRTRQGYRNRRVVTTTQRDSQGRVIGSVETVDVDEYEQYSDSWTK